MTSTATPPPTTALDARAPWMVPGTWVAAVGGACALAATNALVALTWTDVEDSADIVRLAADDPGAFEAQILLSLLTAALLVPGIWAIAARLAARAPVWAALGGWLMGTGYVFSLVLAVESSVLLAVADSGGDPGTVVDALDNHTPLVSLVVYIVFGVGGLLGPILLGVAMLRQAKAVPIWAGITLILSPFVRMGGLVAGISIAPSVASAMIAAAFAATLIATRHRVPR